MKILMINCNNPLRASGIVALDLFNGLRSKGHKVKLLVNEYSPDYPQDIISLETLFLSERNNLISKVKRKLKLLKTEVKNPDYHFHRIKEQDSFYNIKKLLRKADIKPDIIFVLFAKNFINSRNIFELNKLTKAPVLWLMYDMAPLTGGCHYAWDCKGYQNKCGSCPGLYSENPNDVTYKNLLYRKSYIEKTDIQLIAASEWQYRQATSSSLFSNKKIHKILLSVDPKVFKPSDKKAVRTKLGIPGDKKIVFFGAVYLSTKRKGMHYLLESLKILKERLKGTDMENNILLLVAGIEITGIVDTVPFQYHSLGFLDNTYGIAAAYQAADVFLCSSIEDSGPQMINQSIMCGTPVVAFEMGVSLDLVISGQTGYCAKLKDCNDLAQGLINVLSQDEKDYNILSANCRELALKLCSPDNQFDRIETIMKNSLTAR
jgi:glycosyltransferase involved in cell wall biosynthesis